MNTTSAWTARSLSASCAEPLASASKSITCSANVWAGACDAGAGVGGARAVRTNEWIWLNGEPGARSVASSGLPTAPVAPSLCGGVSEWGIADAHASTHTMAVAVAVAVDELDMVMVVVLVVVVDAIQSGSGSRSGARSKQSKASRPATRV